MWKRLVLGIIAAFVMILVNPDPAYAAPSGDYHGFSWRDNVVTVYDGTGQPAWKVAEAASEWSGNGWTIVMTSDPALADIVAQEGPLSGGNFGLARWSVVDGYATHCTITLSVTAGTTIWAQYTARHELGHCLGLAHNSRDKQGSTMNTYVSSRDAVRLTEPSSYDTGNLRALHRMTH